MTLRQKIDTHAAATLALAEEAVRDGEGQLAIELIRQCETLRGWVGGRALTKVNVARKMSGDMDAGHRENISKAHLSHPMMEAARAAGFSSLGDLATALGYDKPWGKSFLSRALKGDKKLPGDKAQKFRELTGKSWKV